MSSKPPDNVVPFTRDASPGEVTWPVPDSEEPRQDYYYQQPNAPRWRMRDEQGRVLFGFTAFITSGKTTKPKRRIRIFIILGASFQTGILRGFKRRFLDQRSDIHFSIWT